MLVSPPAMIVLMACSMALRFATGLKFDRPVEVVVERDDAKAIRILQQRQRSFGRFLGHLDLLAAHTARLVQHDDHCHRIGLFFLGFEGHRQDFFDDRLGIAAFAVIVFTARQNKAAAQIAHVGSESLHLLVVQTAARNIAQNDRVVSVQFFDGGRNGCGIDSIDVRPSVSARLQGIVRFAGGFRRTGSCGRP